MDMVPLPMEYKYRLEINKLEIQISNYENETDFVKGEQIEVKGFVKVASCTLIKF